MLGERLKQLREEMELTQQQLADAIHLTQQKISNYEKDLVEPDCETLVKLADFFETTTDYILDRTHRLRPMNMDSFYRRDLLSNLPDEAVNELDSYVDYLKYKYRNRRKKNSEN